tara:strand:+ start:610 stop:996 length:387 start_codon:yes stop_codon:yes gene_type:complete
MGSARKAPSSIKKPEFEQRVENLKTIPQGSQRSMAFLGLMADSMGGGMIGRAGKATMADDNKPAPLKEEIDSSNFEMADVRKRLLAKAKEEKETNQLMYAKEKQIYDQSLPNQQKNNSSDLQFMVRGG